MSHFITLIKTEYLKRKSAYWLPVWIIAGITLLVLIIALTAMIANWDEIQVGFFNMAFDYEDIQDGVKIGMYGAMAFIAFVFALFMLMSAQNSLSKEKELDCELFYRCQPINIWTCSAAKYLMHVYAGTVLLFIVGFVVAIITAIASAWTIGGFYPGSALYGMLLGIITYLKVCLIFGSLYYFFSSIFNNNAFIKGTALLGIIELIFYLIEELFRNTISLPNIFTNLVAMMGNIGMNGELSLKYALGDYNLLLGVLFAGACYIGATFIYRYKRTEM